MLRTSDRLFRGGWCWRFVECDECEKRLEDKTTKDGLVSWARAKGWIIGRKNHYCSKECRRKARARATQDRGSIDGGEY